MLVKRWLILALIAVFTLSFLLMACSPSAPPEYPEKRIWWVIPSRIPGEKFDADTRLLAKYLPRYLPHEVTVVADRINRGIFHVNNALPDGYSIVTTRIPLMIARQIINT